MIIHCPYCRKPHSLPVADLPAGKAATRCKGCGKRFILERNEEGLTAGPEPAPGYEGARTTENNPGRTPFAEIQPFDEESAPGSVEPETGEWDGPSPLLAEEVVDEEGNSRTEKILQTFPQLRTLEEGCCSFEELFSPDADGAYRNKPNQLKCKLLLAASGLLNGKVLTAGEKVAKIARGIAYYPFEIPYANGLLTLPANYYALVCTSRRLLLINLDHRGSRPSRFIFQIYYAEIVKVSRGLFGTSMIIKTDNGEKWNFTTVKPALARDLASYIRNRIAEPDRPAKPVPVHRQLCPNCLTPLGDSLESCPACRTRFKNGREAMKRSLLLPGMGEIYLGSYLPGFSVLTGYLVTWLIAVVLIILDLAGGIAGAAILIVFYHLFAALMARRLGRKGYVAENLNQPVEPASQPTTEPEGPGPTLE